MPGSDPTAAAKEDLRLRISAELSAKSIADRALASSRACALLEEQPEWRSAKSVLFYAPLAAEVDVWPLVADSLAEGKTVLLPRFDPRENAYIACSITHTVKDIREGRFGVREPVESCPRFAGNHLGLILVPGMAFDLDGRRLGRGKGYYDKLLATLRGTTCGVGFDEQIVERVPTAPHDIRLSCILTPTRWHRAGGPRAVLK